MPPFTDNGGRGRGGGERDGRRGRWRTQHSSGRPESDRVQLSKRLTYALRHGADKLGLHLSPDGYVRLDELLSKSKFRNVCQRQVEDVVASDEKGRMTITTDPEDGEIILIRANQGHSLKGVLNEDQLLTRIEDPSDVDVCVHGTSRKSWSRIRDQGLRCMNRTHIHFAAGLPGNTGIISGMRRSCQVLIYVDIGAAMADGVKFFRSSNNVILSSGVDGILDPKYFARVDGGEDAVPGHTASEPVSGREKGRPSVVEKGEAIDVAPSAGGGVDVYAILDFEATCQNRALDDGRFGPPEIIEFPTVMLDARSLEVLDEFRVFVRPVRNPQLTPFCTSLTGIEQSTVDGGVLFTEALAQHTEFLRHMSCLPGQDRSCLFITCGDWDLKTMLPKQCELINEELPVHLKTWTNVKTVFREVVAMQQPNGRPRHNNNRNSREKLGMASMLSELDLTFDGRHHSGLDDCRNIAKIVAQLCRLSGGPIRPTIIHGVKQTSTG